MIQFILPRLEPWNTSKSMKFCILADFFYYLFNILKLYLFPYNHISY